MKHAILLVAYGVATLQGRRVLARFDKRVRSLFPTYSVRWAYSSPLVRQRLAAGGLKSDSVTKALLRMRFERFERVLVQPLQTIAGSEHEAMLAQIAHVVRESQLIVQVGTPLLYDEHDIRDAAHSLILTLPPERLASDDVIFMGHGSKHPASTRYEELHWAVQKLDRHVHIGTMEGRITLETLLPLLSSRRIWLLPLLATVGRHTLTDMAGRAPTSWRSRLEASGFHCRVVLEGTVERSQLADIWLRHLQCIAGRTPCA